MRGEADDRRDVPLRVRQLALEAGKLLVHVEAGGSGGRRGPGGVLPGRVDGRTGAALPRLLQVPLTALLVALAGALVLLPSLERGDERNGDQQANANQVQNVHQRGDHKEDDHDSDGDREYLEPAHRRPPPLTRPSPDGRCISSELTSSRHWPVLRPETRRGPRLLSAPKPYATRRYMIHTPQCGDAAGPRADRSR